MTTVFDTYQDCRQHIEKIVVHPSPCREKLTDIAEWMYGLHQQFPSVPPVRSYATNKPNDLRFFFRNQGRDHFALYVMGKDCARLSVFDPDGRGQRLAGYIAPQPGNQSWPWIKREEFEKQSIDNIKRDIFRAYCIRLESVMGIKLAECESTEAPIGVVNRSGALTLSAVEGPISKEYQPTPQDWDDACARIKQRTGQRTGIAFDSACDEIARHVTRQDRPLAAGWREKLRPMLSRER